jgi:hypothetical protein
MKLRKYNGIGRVIEILSHEIALQSKEKLRHHYTTGARYVYEKRISNMKIARKVLTAMKPAGER